MVYIFIPYFILVILLGSFIWFDMHFSSELLPTYIIMAICLSNKTHMNVFHWWFDHAKNGENFIL